MGLYSVIGFDGVFVSLCTTSRVYTPLCHNNQVTCTRLLYLSRKWLYHHIVSMFVLFGKSVENQVKSRLSGCWYCLFESRFNTFSSWRLGCVLEMEISITVDKEVKKRGADSQCWRCALTGIFIFSVLVCPAGQSMNRWSLEEMVKRDPENFLILLQQIIRKTREVRGPRGKKTHCPLCVVVLSHLHSPVCVQVQEECQYELVAPLAIMFLSTLLQVQTYQLFKRFWLS